MIRNYVYIFILSLSLAACGGSGNSSSPAIADRTHVLGSWDDDDPNCAGFITFSQSFGSGITLAVAVSGAEVSPNVIIAEYQFLPNTGRDALTLNIGFDNGLADCNGDIGNLAGQNLTVFVEFNGNTMQWFEQAQGGNSIQTLTFNATASSNFSPSSSDPAFAVTNLVITPNPVTTGAFTQIMAVVDYTVTDPNGATINFVFNDIFIEPGITLERPASSVAQVSQGSGQVTLFRDVIVPDWGDDASFVGAISIGNATGLKTVVTQDIQQTP